MGKWTDKNYITSREWSEDFGGAKPKPNHHDFCPLPFDHCSLTLLPFLHPVCDAKGNVFDRDSITEYIIKYDKTNPVDGSGLDHGDLLELEFFRNGNNALHCPITLKTFSGHSHIVTIPTSGRVYSMEGLRKLQFRDFVTDECIDRDTLIMLQDPGNPQKRNWTRFREHSQMTEMEIVNPAGPASRVVNLVAQEQQVKQQLPSINAPSKEESGKSGQRAMHSTGRLAASLTSTAMTPVVHQEYAMLSRWEVFAKSALNSPAHATIRTNRGDLHFELFPAKAPKCVYNFLRLAREGYYAGCKFHRLLPGFMIQGGDPTGSGKGGESVFGRPFHEAPSLPHSSRGLLSMANLGRPGTNTSQFFITFAPCAHLDYSHPVFGRMLHGGAVLDAIEATRVDGRTNAPLEDILIEDIIVVDYPFDDSILQEGKGKESERSMKGKALPSSHTVATIGKYLPKK